MLEKRIRLTKLLNDNNHYKLKTNESLGFTKLNNDLITSAVVTNTDNIRQDLRHNILLLDNNALLLYTDTTNHPEIHKELKTYIHDISTGLVDINIEYVSQEYLMDTEFSLLCYLNKQWLLDIRFKVIDNAINDIFISGNTSYEF